MANDKLANDKMANDKMANDKMANGKNVAELLILYILHKYYIKTFFTVFFRLNSLHFGEVDLGVPPAAVADRQHLHLVVQDVGRRRRRRRLRGRVCETRSDAQNSDI
jgi:hypothetical protein